MHSGFYSRQRDSDDWGAVGKFVHERGILCAELWWGVKFVHGRGVSCAELLRRLKFVHGRGVWCTKLRTPEG